MCVFFLAVYGSPRAERVGSVSWFPRPPFASRIAFFHSPVPSTHRRSHAFVECLDFSLTLGIVEVGFLEAGDDREELRIARQVPPPRFSGNHLEFPWSTHGERVHVCLLCSTCGVHEVPLAASGFRSQSSSSSLWDDLRIHVSSYLLRVL